MSVLNQGGEDAVECPLCMEPLEVDDLNFFPCTCGYQICRFCWHRIRTDENGLCPACRKAYSENPADFKPLSKEEIARLKVEKRIKDQQRKQRVTENRKHLANVRVVQKNLVFVVGLPMRLADPDVLKRHEYFGKFGKIHKVVINQSTSYAGSQGPSASAYVTYQRQEDALRAIEAVNNIVVDGRTIKTSLGTTKYCSHFMRNQTCPKPDCMYLHDLGDQEASFTKEEMHQGKHQEYERKLVQSLLANTSSQRKPTPSPTVSGNAVRDSGTSNSQTKEAWPSLQSGLTNSAQPNYKEPSTPIQIPIQQTNVIDENSTNVVQNLSLPTVPAKKHSNNNKGENGVGLRRGKNNSESKVQAARNKHKNCQNKEKSNARVMVQPELTYSNTQIVQDIAQPHANGQNEFETYSADSIMETEQKTAIKIEVDYSQPHSAQGSEFEIMQKMNDLKINGMVQIGDFSYSDRDEKSQPERSTPVSTISNSDDSNANEEVDHLVKSKETNDSSALLGSSPKSLNSSQNADHQSSTGPYIVDNANISQSQLNRRSIFPADNNSFFSSNNFQKVSNSISTPSMTHTANSTVDWMNSGNVSIPDSLPTVYSSEDWQAAFGFQNESSQAARSMAKSNRVNMPRVPFHSEDFLVEDTYTNSQYPCSNSTTFVSNLLVNSPASKFMADFQQNSLQQRLVMQAQQNYENSEYLKQNGYTALNKVQTPHVIGPASKADDDLGFDPFHETQKALAELMENEIQIQQQRLLQQQQEQKQQQQLKEREDNRVQVQCSLGPQHFSQVAHLAQLQHQAQHLQNLQALQNSHSLLSRLPQDFIQQNTAQGTITVTNLGQRSRLPPPGFPSSSTNHMNSFGLGIPRPASSELLMSTGSKMLPFASHSSGVILTGQTSHQSTYLPNQNSLLNSQGTETSSM
ncbi:alpha-protein kinase 1 isoform X2 [Belonocnema kinseyi]|uniref:alpha-protein kinase 1 isoform X2 n=1 Tax=Belonocnema kinseyi TaxID=2817044 RepID=UPI00143DE4DF|nr:alpha-protein kinase 1 isoform X2 [Belonocnema kinseyi]